MKNINKFFLFLLLIFSSNYLGVKTFGIKPEGILLIFFLKENKEPQNKISSEDYMKKLMFKELYSTFNIGIPSQNIKFYYEMNSVESSISQEFYFPKRSTTYIFKQEKKNLNISQDIFILDKDFNLNNFTFIFKKRNEEGNLINYNALGLGYKKDDYDLSFLYMLNKKGFIKKRIFSFLLGDDSFAESRIYDGQILLGDYPHAISPYFKENELKFISLKEKENWSIEFDSIKYNDYELKDTLVKLDINLNVIIGPEKLRKKLIDTLFYEALQEGKCKEKYFTSDKNNETYIFYSFENSIKFKEIPILFFYSEKLNETFKISFTNLFEFHENKYLFNIIFSKNPKNDWFIGQKFLNNCKFVFDLDNGRIGYYKSSMNKYSNIIIFFCLIFCFSVIIIGYMRGYFRKKSYINKIQKPLVVRKEYDNNNTINENNKNENDKIINDKPKKD